MWEVFVVIAESAWCSVLRDDKYVGEIDWEKDWRETLIIARKATLIKRGE